jgi:uncharacterized tellurite resistance protein B-like protein
MSIMRKAQLSMLVQLATIDNELAASESKWLQKIGLGIGLKEEEIEEVFRKPNQASSSFLHLSIEERFEYLYNLIQLMKIDGKIFQSEIEFCKQAAEKLGFQAGVVKALSSSIYADPYITGDRNLLLKKAQSYYRTPVA